MDSDQNTDEMMSSEQSKMATNRWLVSCSLEQSSNGNQIHSAGQLTIEKSHCTNDKQPAQFSSEI